jgi:hypothetical protein
LAMGLNDEDWVNFVVERKVTRRVSHVRFEFLNLANFDCA